MLNDFYSLLVFTLFFIYKRKKVKTKAWEGHEVKRSGVNQKISTLQCLRMIYTRVSCTRLERKYLQIWMVDEWFSHWSYFQRHWFTHMLWTVALRNALNVVAERHRLLERHGLVYNERKIERKSVSWIHCWSDERRCSVPQRYWRRVFVCRNLRSENEK